MYMPPSDFPYLNKYCFQTLYSDVINFQSAGKVMLMEDQNARTGKEADCIDLEGNTHIYRITSVYESQLITETEL